ncbi:hypothetical protein ZWY2020_058667 [Hordeum vulgare]|nr:hypothetical protein ZWY2020_058667 [Hordeum vulgare]
MVRADEAERSQAAMPRRRRGHARHSGYVLRCGGRVVASASVRTRTASNLDMVWRTSTSRRTPGWLPASDENTVPLGASKGRY